MNFTFIFLNINLEKTTLINKKRTVKKIPSSNSVVKKYESILSDAHKDVWNIEKEITTLENEIAQIKKAAREKDLFENGVEFDLTDDYHDRISLDVRWDYRIYGIKGVKVTRVTPSGKSYDLDLKINRKRWINDKYEDFIEDRKVKSVRADNVWNMINMNRNRIKS